MRIQDNNTDHENGIKSENYPKSKTLREIDRFDID